MPHEGLTIPEIWCKFPIKALRSIVMFEMDWDMLK